MNITDIQLIRISKTKFDCRFDTFFSTPPIFVDSIHEIRPDGGSKSLALILRDNVSPEYDLVFQIDKLLYTWSTHYNQADCLILNDSIELIKTNKLNTNAIQYGRVVNECDIQILPRIGVFMSDNRALESDLHASSYNSHVAAINYTYCMKHKYDFIYYRPYLDSKESYSLYNCVDPRSGESRHASWSKLLSALDMFKSSYDYIVYIDSDCIFKDYNRRIEEFFPQMSSYDILFLNNLPWNDDKPCAGFFICKNSETAHNYIHNWYTVNLPEKNKIHAYEQDALWTIYNSWNVYIANSWMFHEHDGQFLRHICHLETDLRSRYFKQFISDHTIDYGQVISNIRVRHFDTRQALSEKNDSSLGV